MKKRIIISFDYEMFFGDNPGTVQKSLLEPTSKILDALDYANGKATFFVDYLMLKYMLREDEKAQHEARLIIEQIKDIVGRGHRIELHIHPHWVDAKYKDGQWDFSDFSHYMLNTFSEEEVTNMFIEGTNYLESLAREVLPGYKIIAFRAGGWAVLPFSMLKKGFEMAGIMVDSSIMKGQVIHAYGYDLDFTTAPADSIYRFDDILKKSDKGEFIEAQISAYKMNPITFYLRRLHIRFRGSDYGRLTDGSHFRAGDKRTPTAHETKWAKMHRTETFGLTGLPSALLNYYIRHSNDPNIVLISHPKDLSRLVISCIRGFKNRFVFATYLDLI